MFVIVHKKNKSYYKRTLFKGQKHFVKDINEAKKMKSDYALKILNNFNHKNNYEIKEVKDEIFR